MGECAMPTRPKPWAPVLFVVLGIAAAAGCGLLSAGCSDSDPPTRNQPPDAIDRSSPQAVLESLREAYLHRRAADVDSLLAADYEFCFSEEDHRIAEKLTRGEDLLAHWGLFGCERVEHIRLDFSVGALSLDESKPDPSRPGEYLSVVPIANVDLEVRCRDIQGERRTYRLENGAASFWFRQETRVEPRTGDPIWLIVAHRELTTLDSPGAQAAWSHGPPENSTWGQIKALFASGDCP